MSTCTRGVLICTKYGLRTREAKMIDERKPRRNAPRKWFKLSQGHGCLPESAHVSIHIYCILSSPNKLLLVSLVFIFVRILFCKADGPGPCQRPVVYWLGFSAFTATTQHQSLARNQNPASSHGRLRPSEITLSCEGSSGHLNNTRVLWTKKNKEIT